MKSLTQPLPSVLPKIGDDRIRVDRALAHARFKAGNVVGRLRGNAMDEGAARHGRLAITAADSATAPKTPPCIVTILIAAS